MLVKKALSVQINTAIAVFSPDSKVVLNESSEKSRRRGSKTGLLEIGKNIGLDYWRYVLTDCYPANMSSNKKVKFNEVLWF